jgi:hypothetical protein
MARKIAAKSARCSGRSFASARSRSAPCREDHLAHRVDLLALEEHVLGAAQADALGPEEQRGLGLVALVGVGAHAQRARASAQAMSSE